MTFIEQIDYWLEGAEHDLDVAERLFNSGDYDWCLFIGHLVLEKILKSYYCKINQSTPPKIHDLNKLATLSKLDLNLEKKEFFHRVNDFNLEARYPEYKLHFYKVATKEFATNNFTQLKKEFLWIKSLIK